jgi:hypothetical protein
MIGQQRTITGRDNQTSFVIELMCVFTPEHALTFLQLVRFVVAGLYHIIPQMKLRLVMRLAIQLLRFSR